MTLFRFFRFGFMLIFAWTFAGSAVADTGQPIVYTGHYTRTDGQRMLTRVTLLPPFGQTRPMPAYSAFVVMQLGPDGGPEYVGLYYDTVLVNEAGHELLLQRDDDARARRLPTIRLQFDEDGTTANGEVFSQTEGHVGQLTLVSGWDLPADVASLPTVDELGGIYSGQCQPRGSSLVLENLELVPSRIYADRLAPEGALTVLDFIGNGTCPSHELVNCVNFSGGFYNFFKRPSVFDPRQLAVDLHA